MLKQLRNGAQSTLIKIFLFGLLVMAMGGLVFMDVQGVLTGSVSTGTVASYKGGKIKVPEFTYLVQSTLRQQRIAEEDAQAMGIPMRVLQDEVTNRLFRLAAHDVGLKIGDDVAAYQVKQIISPFIEQGLSPDEALKRMLYNAGMSEDQFVRTIKNTVASQQLVATISSSVQPSKSLVDALLKHKHEQRRGSYFTLTANDASKIQAPTDAELEEYYAPIAVEYALPEYRTLSIVTLDSSVIGKGIAVSKDRIKQAYEENKESFASPEMRTIAQAVIKDETKANKIVTAARGKKTLEEATKAEEETFLSANEFSEEGLPVELSEAAFKAKAGEIVGPIKSPLGWHVLHIQKITPARTKTLAEASKDIEKELKHTMIEEDLYEVANSIDDAIAGGATLSEIVEQHKLKVTTLEKVDRDGLNEKGNKPLKQPPMYEDILEAAFELDAGMISHMLETDDNKFIVVSAKEIFPARVRALKEVRDEIVKRWTTAKKTTALSDKAADIMERIKSGKSTLAAEAKELGKKVKTTGFIKRDNEKLDQASVNALFHLNKHQNITSISTSNAVKILMLDEVKHDVTKDISVSEFNTMEGEITRNLRQDVLNQFRASLADKYNLSINEELVQRLYSEEGETALY